MDSVIQYALAKDLSCTNTRLFTLTYLVDKYGHVTSDTDESKWITVTIPLRNILAIKVHSDIQDIFIDIKDGHPSKFRVLDVVAPEDTVRDLQSWLDIALQWH
jgi:hypothetical protein